ncbi:MAG: protein-glutamate O-methyltransferase CheR [Acidobacteriota bacterium]
MIRDPFNGPSNLVNDELYRRYCVLIREKTGLHFNDTSRFYLEKRLENRMRDLQVESFEDYFNLIQYDPEREQEWARLIATITTNETYFMREERQLRCFQREILPALWRLNPGQTIRIWSAGCSSGEEPYTLAILIREGRAVPEEKVEIYATDINERVLAKAKEGLYGPNSFRAVDDSFKARWFRREGGGHYRLREEIRERVKFGRFNLFDIQRYSLLAPFNVVFCRNVIIYFDLEAKVRVVERFHEKMKPGGFLLLGHYERLI